MNEEVFKWLDYRILTCYEEAKKILGGVEMPNPRMAVLYPTYACNHNCNSCDYGEVNFLNKAEKPAMWNLAEGNRVIKEIVKGGFSSVEWCGGGEPTLYPYLNEMIHKHLDCGLPFGMLTNGTKLQGELAETIAEHGTYCRISIESATEESFNLYKKPRTPQASFSTVVKNVTDLCRMRDELGSKLSISYKYVIDNTNFYDVFNAFELAQQMGVDCLQFKLVSNVPGRIPNGEQINYIMEQIDLGSDLYPDVTMRNQFDRTFLKEEAGTDKGACWMCPMFPVIEAEGNVMMCCYFRPRYDRHCIGNIFENTWDEIWGSKRHWEAMKNIKREECNMYDCRYHGFNLMMKKLIADGEGQFEFM